jgi:hypothetical protein
MMFMIEVDVTDPFDKPTEWWLDQSVKLVERSEGVFTLVLYVEGDAKPACVMEAVYRFYW